MMEFEGIVVEIRFRNEDNYYTVFLLDTEDGPITCVGNVASISVGDMLVVSGNIIYHDQYGEQVSIQNTKKMMPTTTVQIERYLASGIIPFIGEKIAKKLVGLYGEKTLEIITENPDALLNVRGLGKKRVAKIHEVLVREKGSRETLIYLQSLGLGNKGSMNIYKIYKDHTREIIEKNPYRLIEDVRGIGFKIADEIALRNGILETDSFRISAGLVYYLGLQANSNGNCYVDLDLAIRDVAQLLAIDQIHIKNSLLENELNGKIKIQNIDSRPCIYSRLVYEQEQNVVSHMLRLILEEEQGQQKILDLVDQEEGEEGIVYSDTQKEAILEAIYKKVLIITGGPGTGKTTIIKGIISLLEKMDMSFSLCAPTGRAAKRMEESTGHQAQTIHRLLGYKGLEEDEVSFLEHDEDNPLDTECIIVDEVSMIDIGLMSNLLNAIDNKSKLILVGDVDQLPSVGPGNVLSDLINSGIIKTIRLDRIFRQGETSNIVKNAHLINQGKKPILNEEGKDFFFIKTQNEKHTLDTLVDLVKNRLPSHYKLDPLKDIQVLTPMRKGICGVDSINLKLQEVLNPKEYNKQEMVYGSGIYRENDRIMQIKNNYDLAGKDKFSNVIKGVFNGDMGFIRNIIPDQAEVEAVIDDKVYTYEYKSMSELTLSYSITIHKSQGSEFPIVVIPMVSGPYMLLTRNILYTAITRGKTAVVLVGDERIMNRMIQNNYRQERNSSLAYFLQKTYSFYKDED